MALEGTHIYFFIVCDYFLDGMILLLRLSNNPDHHKSPRGGGVLYNDSHQIMYTYSN
jgi:hypothetical protein